MSLDNHSTHLQSNTTYKINEYLNNVLMHTKLGMKKARSYYIYLVIYVFLTMCYLTYVDRLSSINIERYASVLLLQISVYMPLLIIFVGVLGALRRGKRRRIYALKTLFNSKNVSNFLVGFSILTLFIVFLSMFTAAKGTFGPVFGFDHDIWQADLDKILFFGLDPWRLIFLPIHSLELQKIIELNYNVIWHIQLFAVLAIVAYSGLHSKTRVRYLMCTLLVWSIVGSVFAGMFLSAGPAFYALVTGDEYRFGEQMALLREHAESSAIVYQSYLWRAYIADASGFGTGIAAFPSLHVSFVVLHSLFAFEINKKLGFLVLFYAIFVWFSSVYLAWHYAIDGLFGGILVVAIYYFVRRFMGDE